MQILIILSQNNLLEKIYKQDKKKMNHEIQLKYVDTV